MTKGYLVVAISQINAAKMSRNMYNNENSVGVESDLASSYAWDTAIVFIQEMGNTNYANKTSVNTKITNTGTTMDKVCNIYDMASNIQEWTTEYSLSKTSSRAEAGVRRGGHVDISTYYVANRHGQEVNNTGFIGSFRPIAYIK